MRTEEVEVSLGKSNIAKLNNDEVAVLAPLLDLPPDPTAFAQRMLLRYNLQLV